MDVGRVPVLTIFGFRRMWAALQTWNDQCERQRCTDTTGTSGHRHRLLSTRAADRLCNKLRTGFNSLSDGCWLAADAHNEAAAASVSGVRPIVAGAERRSLSL